MRTLVGIAKLNDEDVKKLAAIEKDLNAIVVAYEKPTPVAEISAAKLQKIESLEKEIGVRLVAYL